MAVRNKDLAALSQDTIVAAALAIADRDGLAALSMRGLAQRLQCNPMSLYGYVENKDALLDLMADTSMAALPRVDPRGDWRAEMLRFCLAVHDLFVEHPAVAHVMVERPLSGATTMRRGERVLEMLLAAGFTAESAVALFIALTNYTVGASLYRLSRSDARQPLAAHRFDAVTEAEHPVLHRLAPVIASAGERDQVVACLTHLLAGYEPETPNPPSDRETDR